MVGGRLMTPHRRARPVAEKLEASSSDLVADVPEQASRRVKKLLPCTECNANFKTTGYLALHMQLHAFDAHSCSRYGTDSKQCGVCHNDHHNAIEHRFACTKCDASFRVKVNLANHMRTHTGKRPYACRVCTAAFKQKSNLDNHMRLHTGELPYACWQCDARFRQRSNLDNHMRVHTGERPYSCSRCTRSFKQRSNLNAHLRQHTGETPYSCDKCGRRFKQKSNLDYHVRSQCTKYECDWCDESFRWKVDLVLHARSHADFEADCKADPDADTKPLLCVKSEKKSDAKPHTQLDAADLHCEQCKIHFSSMKNFQRHMGIHNRNAEFRCQLCGASFWRKDYVKRHCLRHH